MDEIIGTPNDDTLTGTAGDDTFRSREGDDVITGLAGDDTDFRDASDPGNDSVDLGAGSDVVRVGSGSGQQVRLTFTSSEVGNGSPTDSNTMMNQNGGLAVRLQLERSGGTAPGDISRFDDEGITFLSVRPGLFFDVRDLVTGAERGDAFRVVQLGTSDGDRINQADRNLSYYINAGGGDDSVVGSRADDFLVGGSGDDRLSGQAGDDTFIGGSGDDLLIGGEGADRFVFNAPLDGSTNVDTIRGFSTDDDAIRLESDVFAGLPEGALDPEAFALVTDAGEADDRIIYNQVTGRLLFDADGGDRGNAVVFARLLNAPDNLSADDFAVI